MIAAGSVEEFHEGKLEMLRGVIAAVASVDALNVTVELAPASVLVTAIIAAPSQRAAEALVARLATKFNSQEAASAMLGEIGVTIEATPSLRMEEISDVLTPSSDQVYVIILAAVLGGVAVMTTVCTVAAIRRFKRRGPTPPSSVDSNFRIKVDPTPTSTAANAVPTGIALSEVGKPTQLNAPVGLRVVSASELHQATDGWSKARKIGEGGFGAVYVARAPTRLSREGWCALKRMRADGQQGTGQQGLVQFETEIRLLAKVHHPNVLPLLGCCQEGAMVCLIYPLMAGGDLERRLLRMPLPAAMRKATICGAAADEAQSPILTWRERLRIARDVTRGLLHLHSQQPPLLHRDVKPTNILLDERNDARLADIGLAKQMPELQNERTHVSSLTQLGTPGFIDPLISRLGHYSTETDAYAMGVTYAMLLVGKRVLETLDVADVMLEDPSHAPSVAEAAAEWPAATAIELGQIVRGLTVPRLRHQRLALSAVLHSLESLCEAEPAIRPGTAPTPSRECVVCLSEPRAARFRCGHCVCCEACGDQLESHADTCPICRAPAAIMARGAHLATENTFVEISHWLRLTQYLVGGLS